MGDISRVVLSSTAEFFDHQEAEEEEKKEEKIVDVFPANHEVTW